MTLLICVLVLSSTLSVCHGGFSPPDLHLTILHTTAINRYPQYDSSYDTCSDQDHMSGMCFGGIPRQGTIIEQVRNEREDINVLLLDAGDRLFGEWFDIYQGMEASFFMNRLGYDAMTLGNQDFTRGTGVLGSFLENITFPAISANLNTTLEPDIDGLVDKSLIRTIDGQQVGIIGYGVQRFNTIAQVGNAYFEDVITALQDEVNVLKSQGVNKIIVLAHSWGYVDDEDVEVITIAQSVSGIDIMVLGGLNLFQYAGCPPIKEDILGDYVTDKYPIQVTPDENPDGKVLIVHGFPEGKYIGRLNVVFDHDGNISEWYGEPIRLDNRVPQDPDLLDDIERFAEGITDVNNRFVGYSLVLLQGSTRGMLICRRQECNMGNLITDAMVNTHLSTYDDMGWNDVAIGLMNGGGIRASIRRGPITFGDVKAVLPFGNTFDRVDLKGSAIRAVLNHSVSSLGPDAAAPGMFLQVSGIKVTYDLQRDPKDGRVKSVEVLCTKCPFPKLVPLEDDELYGVVVNSFIGGGGDGYDVIKNNGTNYISGDLGEIVLAKYIEQISPVILGIEDRITIE